MSLIDNIERLELGDVGHFNTPLELDSTHFLFKIQVLRRGEHELYKQHRGT